MEKRWWLLSGFLVFCNQAFAQTSPIKGSLPVEKNISARRDSLPSRDSLEEVVVTAYGNTGKKAFTGTAVGVNAEQIRDQQVGSFTNTLQGESSGIWVLSENGQPGQNPDVRIRGIGSVNASADPLIVLDGAPYGGFLSSIPPGDIEKITILKDASSTALYGSRASNGVILVTTRSGKKTTKLTASLVRGVSARAVADYHYVNNNQLYELTWEALRNQALITPGLLPLTGAASPQDYASRELVGTLVYNPFGLSMPVGADGKIVAGAKNLWTEDWYRDLTRAARRTEGHLSLSGGGEHHRYYWAGTYLDEEGLFLESRFQRYTGRLNWETRPGEWLWVGLNTSGSYSRQNDPTQGGTANSNLIGWIRNISGIFPEYLRDPVTGAFLTDASGNKQFDYGNNGPLQRPLAPGSNPAGTATLNPILYDRILGSLNGYAETKILAGLKGRSQYALDLFQTQFSQFFNPFVGDGAAYGGSSEKKQTQSNTQTFTNTLSYDKSWGPAVHLNGVVGMEAYRFHEGVLDAEARGFSFPGVTELQYGSLPTLASSYSYDDRMLSYFGRLNYDLNGTYHASISFRRDGSSRFADSVRWGSFGSIGLAWNLQKEKFVKGIHALSNCKIRASFGTTGNQLFLDAYNNPLYFPYLATYAAGANIAGYAGSTLSNLANGRLTWESQQDLDLGIDIGFLHDRITGNLTWFNRQSDRLFFARPLPPSSGIDYLNDNIGGLNNKGIELDLTLLPVDGKKCRWTCSLHLSRVRNRITALPQPSLTGPDFSEWETGKPLNNFYIREYAGVDPVDGSPQWYRDQVDASGSIVKTLTKQYDAATRYFEGTSLPDWTGGFSNSLRFKHFECSILAFFRCGGKIYDADYAGLMYAAVGDAPGRNWSPDILNRWQSPGMRGDGKTPRLTTTTDDQSNSVSTRFLFGDTYMRIRNIALGYSLPKPALNNTRLSAARVFLTLQNPFTIFHRKGLDPEGGGLAGITSNTSSLNKTFSAGLNLDF